MKIWIEIEVNGPEEELKTAAQKVVDFSNQCGRIPVPGTGLMLSEYKVYKKRVVKKKGQKI